MRASSKEREGKKKENVIVDNVYAIVLIKSIVYQLSLVDLRAKVTSRRLITRLNYSSANEISKMPLLGRNFSSIEHFSKKRA